MKRLKNILLIACTSFFLQCNSESNKEINPKKLAGVYKVELNSFFNNPEFKKNLPEELMSFSESVINFMTKTIDIKFVFGEHQTGGVIIDKKLKKLIEQFTSMDFEDLNSFQYQIVSDTVLKLKMKDEEEFVKAAILKKMGPGYDSLHFSLIENENRVSFVLRKVSS